MSIRILRVWGAATHRHRHHPQSWPVPTRVNVDLGHLHRFWLRPCRPEILTQVTHGYWDFDTDTNGSRDFDTDTNGSQSSEMVKPVGHSEVEIDVVWAKSEALLWAARPAPFSNFFSMTFFHLRHCKKNIVVVASDIGKQTKHCCYLRHCKKTYLLPSTLPNKTTLLLPPTLQNKHCCYLRDCKKTLLSPPTLLWGHGQERFPASPSSPSEEAFWLKPLKSYK